MCRRRWRLQSDQATRSKREGRWGGDGRGGRRGSLVYHSRWRAPAVKDGMPRAIWRVIRNQRSCAILAFLVASFHYLSRRLSFPRVLSFVLSHGLALLLELLERGFPQPSPQCPLHSLYPPRLLHLSRNTLWHANLPLSSLHFPQTALSPPLRFSLLLLFSWLSPTHGLFCKSLSLTTFALPTTLPPLE